jgi:hypothetical protein
MRRVVIVVTLCEIHECIGLREFVPKRLGVNGAGPHAIFRRDAVETSAEQQLFRGLQTAGRHAVQRAAEGEISSGVQMAGSRHVRLISVRA